MAAGHMPYMIKFVPLFITIETWSKYRQQLTIKISGQNSTTSES